MAQQRREFNAPMLLLVFCAGFDASDKTRLSSWLDDCTTLGARWRTTDDRAADLWIVNGARARSPARGLIEMTVPETLRLRPAEMPHPIAFAEPLDGAICTSHRFDPQSMQSLGVLLSQLARWLTPKLVQQALMEQLVANGASFTRSNVIEVHARGRTLALIDFEGDTAVAADATPAEVKGADWRLRPRGDRLVPPGFRIAPTEQVVWQFAQRTPRSDLLPSRYSRLPIHLRRVPALPPRDLADRHLQVLRELAYGPRSFGELRELTGCADAVLRRDLAGLYLVSAITCDPGRSRASREHRRAAALSQAGDLSFIGTRPSELGELTAPGFAR